MVEREGQVRMLFLILSLGSHPHQIDPIIGKKYPKRIPSFRFPKDDKLSIIGNPVSNSEWLPVHPPFLVLK